MRANLSVPCPVCKARVGELCTEPTREQIDKGLPSDEPWNGQTRKRVHDSRVLALEEKRRSE